jgi:hypothetical protein
MWGIEEFAKLGGRRVWSDYEDASLLEFVVALSKKTIRKFYNARVGDAKGPGRLNEPPAWEDRYGLDVFVLNFWNKAEAREVYLEWLKELIGKEEHRGADDGSYDYYPAAWEVAKQIAEALGMKDEYNAAVKELRENSEYGDPGGDLFELIEEIK